MITKIERSQLQREFNEKVFEDLTSAGKIKYIEDFYSAHKQISYQELSENEKEFYDNYTNRFSGAEHQHIISILRPEKSFSQQDEDLFAAKGLAILKYKNKIREEFALDPLPNTFLTDEDIENLIASGSISDFLKKEITDNGKTIKPNQFLKRRIDDYVALKNLNRRHQEEIDNFRTKVSGDLEAIKSAKPVETIKDDGKLIINPDFEVWQDKAKSLFKKVQLKIVALESYCKAEGIQPDKRDFLYRTRNNLFDLLES